MKKPFAAAQRRFSEATGHIINVARDLPAEERARILQILDLAVSELQRVDHLKALVSLLDLLTDHRAFASRIVIATQALAQYDVDSLVFFCPKCGQEFGAANICAKCAFKALAGDEGETPAEPGGQS